jgi:hypothetical protein
VLAAHPDLQLRVRRTTALGAEADELADAFLVDRLKLLRKVDAIASSDAAAFEVSPLHSSGGVRRDSARRR